MDNEGEYYQVHRFHDRARTVPGELVEVGESFARGQMNVILLQFQMMPNLYFSSEDIRKRTGILETSVRRALTNLCKQKKLEEGPRIDGPRGMPINTYTLAKPTPPQTNLFGEPE